MQIKWKHKGNIDKLDRRFVKLSIDKAPVDSEKKQNCHVDICEKKTKVTKCVYKSVYY